MANEEHLSILRQGIDVWNAWRLEEAEIKPNLAYTDLSATYPGYLHLERANFSHADFEGTDFENADLERADLRHANLISTKLDNTNLTCANLSYADLRNAEISNTNFSLANLSHSNLSYLDLRSADFSAANLRYANLMYSNLSYLDLSDLDLSGANLSRAELVRTQALATNFAKAIFTGAYLEDWHINSSSNLENVNCDYVFLKISSEERRPSDPNKNFVQGEFSKLFQKALSAVDLIFRNGVDWNALLTSLDKLRIEAEGAELSIQSIENKNDGAFVVRVNVPPEANKAKVEKFLKHEYTLALKALDAQYKYQLQAKEREVEIYRQQSTSLIEIAKLMASRPINVEAKSVVENQSKSVEVEMNFQAPVTGATGVNKGVININASECQKTLAESAAEIQRLLKQLEETNPSATEPEQITYVNLSIQPDFKQRAIGALKEGGEVAIEEFFLENKYLKVGKAVIKGWLQGTA